MEEHILYLFQIPLVNIKENTDSKFCSKNWLQDLGFLYTLYVLYFTQPFLTNRIPIPVSIFEVDRLTNKVKLICAHLQNHDAWLSVKKLLNDQALDIRPCLRGNLELDRFGLCQKTLTCRNLISAYADNVLRIDRVPYLKAVCVSYAHARLSFWKGFGKKFCPVANTLLAFELGQYSDLNGKLKPKPSNKILFEQNYRSRFNSIVSKETRKLAIIDKIWEETRNLCSLKTIYTTISMFGLSDRLEIQYEVLKRNVDKRLVCSHRAIRREIHRRDLANKLAKYFFS
jgi:hypothetical protein